jgi:hypothetical protein
VAKDELEEDLLPHLMATTLEEELAPPCLDDVADYFSLAEAGLQYVFLNGDRETLVINSDKLSNDETRRLVATLEKYGLVIAYSLKDLKGISPSLCTRRIPMEQDHKPVCEHQRRLDNAMREVVKKEVLKPLKAGIIYPIFDSEWVNQVQVVLKKGGMTVISNEKK